MGEDAEKSSGSADLRTGADSPVSMDSLRTHWPARRRRSHGMIMPDSTWEEGGEGRVEERRGRGGERGRGM